MFYSGGVVYSRMSVQVEVNNYAEDIVVLGHLNGVPSVFIYGLMIIQGIEKRLGDQLNVVRLALGQLHRSKKHIVL